MIVEKNFLEIEQELESLSNPNIFIVKYHKELEPEIQYLVILAYWKKIQLEQDIQDKLIQLKRFRSQYYAHQDMRIKRLVMFTVAELLKYPEEDVLPYRKIELCNDLIKLGQNFIEKQEPEINLALCEAYWFKVQHHEEKDTFKSEYFYQRIINLSQYLTGVEKLNYRFAAWAAQIKLTIQHEDAVEDDILRYFNDLPIGNQIEIYGYFFDMLQVFLEDMSFNATAPKFEQQLDFLEQMIETEKFTQMINTVSSSKRTAEILQYLTYLFWVGQRLAKSDALILEYFRAANQPVIQLLENNFKFYISDDIDLEMFNRYLSEHYKNFAYLQKYRTLFRVHQKQIAL